MVHRASDKEFAIRARNRRADPVTVRANNLNAVTKRTAP